MVRSENRPCSRACFVLILEVIFTAEMSEKKGLSFELCVSTAFRHVIVCKLQCQTWCFYGHWWLWNRTQRFAVECLILGRFLAESKWGTQFLRPSTRLEYLKALVVFWLSENQGGKFQPMSHLKSRGTRRHTHAHAPFSKFKLGTFWMTLDFD